MFEVYSWSYRFVYTLLISFYCILSYIIIIKKKHFMSAFLPVLNIVITISSFLLLAIISEPMDKNAIYVGSSLIIIYLLTRILLTKSLKLDLITLYDLVFLLLSIGLCMLYRLSSDYGIKQIVFITIGNFALIAAIILGKKMDFKPEQYKYFAYAIFTLLIITQIFGTEVFGSKNWIKVGMIGFQPSEIIKILFAFLMACLLYYDIDLKRFLINSAILLAIVLFFAWQRDLGSAFIFFSVYIIMLFFKDSKYYYTGITIFSAIISGISSYFLFGHIKSRVLAWLSPWQYTSTKAYQITQSLFAIASGGLIGTGINIGNPKYIPAVHTDFIFSAICEEMGIIVAICMLVIYALIVLIGMNICIKCQNKLNQLVSLGLTSMTAIQTLLIVCGVLNLIPITGVTLPFVSYGGSSLLSQFINIGILYYINEKEMSVAYE